ncbi:MAG: hypothetical protein LUC23_00855 [Prevotellaceae bacterium]|nr:hypothetical protein [Prevotellaceae bacterium]
MRQLGEMKIYTHEEMLDRVLGIDTPARQRYEAAAKALYKKMAAKEARIAKRLKKNIAENLQGE